MKITNRLFAYPVLSDEKDDYKESVFNVDFGHVMDGVNSLKLMFDITMDCSELEHLIMNGQAEYVIHLECSSTAFREVLRSVSKTIEYSIPIGRISGSFEVVAFIILNKELAHFYTSDWVDDYQGITFHLLPGSILAYQNLHSLNIEKDYEEFANAESIFSIYKKLTGNDQPAEISLDSAKIKIGLCAKDYDIFAIYSQKTEFQALFHSMLVLPALVYVFEELKQEDGHDNMYNNKEWYIAMEQAYLRRGIVFVDEVLNMEKTSYQLAQEAMELPLSKAFDQIPVFFNISEEES